MHYSQYKSWSCPNLVAILKCHTSTELSRMMYRRFRNFLPTRILASLINCRKKSCTKAIPTVNPLVGQTVRTYYVTNRVFYNYINNLRKIQNSRVHWKINLKVPAEFFFKVNVLFLFNFKYSSSY